jgi:hypothetical protein
MITHQVAGEDDLGALLEEELDGGHGGADAGIVGDLLGVVERHVEVGADEHLLPLQIRLPEGAHAPLGRHPCTESQPRRHGDQTNRSEQGGSGSDYGGPATHRIESAAAVRMRRDELWVCRMSTQVGAVHRFIEAGRARDRKAYSWHPFDASCE